MNREIKFRAWVDNGYIKEMHYTDQIEMNSADAWSLWCLLGFKDTYPEEHRLLDWQKEIKWMQFTGLLDKNGKEIYEGDVVNQEKWVSVGKYEPSIGVVKFKGIGFTCECIGNWQGSNADLNGNATIIGNIYENPNLLQ